MERQRIQVRTTRKFFDASNVTMFTIQKYELEQGAQQCILLRMF